VKTGTGGWQSLPSMPILDCNRSVKCHQNEADLTEYLADMHKYYNYKLCKIALGKDEVAGSNPAISSTCGRLLYYNGRPLLSGIAALNLMKLL